MSRPGRSWMVVLLVALVAVAGASAWFARADDDRAQVVDAGSAREGWKRLEYHDIQVDIPDGWDRRASDDCLVEVEHWGPATTGSCGSRPGLSFLDASTYDAANAPGTLTSSRDAGGRRWHGYVLLGDLVVSASGGDRDVVREVLDSASLPGFQPIE